jgi:hypothetical protein
MYLQKAIMGMIDRGSPYGYEARKIQPPLDRSARTGHP